jgi:glycosyltransferase involved in cell wall biosynthesis
MDSSTSPLISVCIPVFNGEQYIVSCIDSVLSQTFENFELLIVDNCSTDQTAEILSTYQDPRIRIFRNDQNIGSIGNFNKCIELAQGEYFVLLPHDDIIMPNMLDTFSNVLASDSLIGLVYSSYYIIDEKGDKIQRRVFAPKDRVMSSEDALREFISQGNPIQCAMVRRKAFVKLGAFDSSFFALTDIDMWCRIALDGNKVAYCYEPQNCFRVRPDSGQASLKSGEKGAQILSEHLGFVPSQSYMRDNAIYVLAFKYLQALYHKIPKNSDLQQLRAMAVKQWILTPLIKQLMVSILQRSWRYAWQELVFFIKVIWWAGFWQMTPILVGMPFEFLCRQLRNRFQK